MTPEDRKLLRELLHEVRRLRHGDLVARLAPAEMDELARRVADHLHDQAQGLAQRAEPDERAPRRAKRRGYF